MKILKNKKLVAKVGYTTMSVLSIAAGTLLLASPASAQLSTVTTNIIQQFEGLVNVLSGVAYIGGVGFGIKAALKFKEHNETKGQVPLSQPIVMALVAALLIGLPSFIGVVRDSTLGSSAQQSSIQGGAIDTIR
jgi:hypothetical protein